MFKILKSLSKSLGGKSAEAAPPPAPKPSGGGTLLDKVNKGSPAAAKVEPPKNADELCGITGKMGKDEIKAQLKILFRRYNRSASSLDAKIRSEADRMLDAIVSVREKHFGEI
ncbi:MAG TPA: hypothetical protein VGE39_19475 [Prosthecobacter sp.]